MPNPSSLVTQFTESVIRRSTVWSSEHGAVNLAQGFPDDEAPREVKFAAIEAIVNNRNQYSDTWGTLRLREAVAEKLRRCYDLKLNGHDNVTITCGATEALMASLLASTNPGDEVIIFEPCYENFRPQCLLARVTPILVPLDGPTYALNPSALRDAFSEKTAAIIINNPNNPCGKVFSYDELIVIAELCERFDAFAISDEVYEHILFDGRKHICLASIDQLSGRWIVVSSCSKTYFVTGWRIGYAVAPTNITTAIRRCHDFLTGAAPTPFQDAQAVALMFHNDYYDWLRVFYEQKRRLLVDALNAVSLTCVLPEGAYYVLADMSSYIFQDSCAFCEYLMKKVGVAAVPWTSFYSRPELGKSRVRFTFSKSEATISEAVRRLQVLKELPKRS
jgi:aspartate/methionine/tyrosine aminotransferase